MKFDTKPLTTMARHRHLNRFKSLIVVRKHLSLYFIDNNIISW